MDINVSWEEMRKRKIFLAAPLYGGQAAGIFLTSCMDLTATFLKNGMPMDRYFLFNESLITRARNYCVDVFLRSDATHLLFIDSDIGFNPDDVMALLALAGPDSPYDVIGGPYAKKNLSFEKLREAVDKGLAEEDASALADFVGDFVFNPLIKENEATINLGEPTEVLEIGTGFMLIKRSVFERYAEAYPNIFYRPDHVRSADFDGSRKIGMYFQAEIDPESERYLSEDYLFCQRVRKMGGKVWLCPWMKLEHAGSYVFGGSMIRMIQNGIHPTADVSKLNKQKKP